MAFTVSPGIVTREIDLTAIVPEAGTVAGATVGAFQWGPVQDITQITSIDDLKRRFKKPDILTYNYFFTASAFLSYGNNLNVVRVANSSALNATTDTTNAVLITNSSAYYTTYDITQGGSANNFFGNFVAKYPGTLGNSLKVSFCGADKSNTTLTGTVTVAAGSSNVHTVTGASTSFDTELGVGDVIDVNSNSYVVTAVTNSTQITVSGHSASAQGAGNSAVRLVRSAFEEANANMIGVVTVGAGNNTVIGTNTIFDLQVKIGDILTIGGEEHVVNSITSNSELVLRSSMTNAASSAVFSRKWEYHGSFDTSPTTTAYGERKGITQDEIFGIVVDNDGEWTGTAGRVLQTFPNMSVANNAKTDAGTSQYYKEVVNRTSEHIWFMSHNSRGNADASLNTLAWGAAANSSAAPAFQANGIIITGTMSGGADGNTLSDADLITGYDMLNDSTKVDVSIIATANATSTVSKHVISQVAEKRKDCVVCISPEQADVVNNAGSEVPAIVEFRNTMPSTSYAIMDSGYKYMYDTDNDTFRYVPLNGDVAGLMVRTAEERDFFFSPAGFDRGQISPPPISLPFNPNKAQRDTLYKNGVNPVVTFPGQGTILFGDKSLLAKPSAFDRISVRRLFIVLEKSISRFAEAQLFEFNDAFTRARFVSAVEPFLRDIQGRGGITDFSVVCDESNNTQEIIDRNEFVGSIFVKPSRPINFILLNFVAVRSGVEFEEVTNF